MSIVISPDKDHIHCLYGFFNGARIFTEVGELPAITYRILWEKFRDTTSFFNVKWNSELNRWIIYQAVSLDEMVSSNNT